MYEVHLCKECIKMLDEDYPYIVPKNELKIIEVLIGECDNEDLDNYNEKLSKRNKNYIDKE